MAVSASSGTVHFDSKFGDAWLRELHWSSANQPDCARALLSTVAGSIITVAGQNVSVREVEDQNWLVSFMDYDLGYFDNERGRVEPGPNPFTPDKVLTMCPEQGVNHVTG